jgi:hypothetical protein
MTTVYTPLPTTHEMPGRWPEKPTIVTSSVSPEFRDLLLSRRDRAQVLVLPRKTPSTFLSEADTEATQTYDEFDLLFATRALRASGVDIDALHDEAERRLAGQFGADVVIALGLFIAKAIGEVEIQSIYQYVKGRIAKAQAHLVTSGRDDVDVVLAVDLLRVRSSDGTEIEMRGVRGPAEPTADLLRAVLQEHGSADR